MKAHLKRDFNLLVFLREIITTTCIPVLDAFHCVHGVIPV